MNAHDQQQTNVSAIIFSDNLTSTDMLNYVTEQFVYDKMNVDYKIVGASLI